MSDAQPVLNYLELPGGGSFEETKRFYTEAFGWSWLDFGPTYAEFRDAGVQGGLNGLAAAAPPPEPGAEDGVGPLLLFETTDLEAAAAAVTAAGGVVTSGPYGYPGGRRLHFQDPSGNTLGIYQPDVAAE
ncbi:MAG: VOC family protein [Actinomycetota bacterium]